MLLEFMLLVQGYSYYLHRFAERNFLMKRCSVKSVIYDVEEVGKFCAHFGVL